MAAKTNAPTEYGAFESPRALVRPSFRYWLPDAGVDPTIVQKNIVSAGSIGAGDVEFVPFYDYGGELPYEASPGLDWVTYGFGTVAFRDMFVATLNAHKDNGLLMNLLWAGTYIRLPRITHAARLYMNGKRLSAVDPSFHQIDISSALQWGRKIPS
jgi:hypothetical protein